MSKYIEPSRRDSCSRSVYMMIEPSAVFLDLPSPAYWSVVISLVLYNGSVVAELVRSGVGNLPNRGGGERALLHVRRQPFGQTREQPTDDEVDHRGHHCSASAGSSPMRLCAMCARSSSNSAVPCRC